MTSSGTPTRCPGSDVFDPCKVGLLPCFAEHGSPLVLRITWGAGYPFLAPAHDFESVHTRLSNPVSIRCRRPLKTNSTTIPTARLDVMSNSSSRSNPRLAFDENSARRILSELLSDRDLMSAQLGGFPANPASCSSSAANQ